MRNKGVSLAELLVAMTVASILTTAIVAVFHAGNWEFQHSSGRIELIRRARAILDRITPLVTTAVKTSSSAAQEAIVDPPTPVDDLTPLENMTQAQRDALPARLMFTSAMNFFGGGPAPKARELQNNPTYYYYDVAETPGGAGQGSNVLLRRWIRTGPGVYNPDNTVTPMVLGRQIDNFYVRYLRPGAVQLAVEISGNRIQDSVARNRIQQRTPIVMRVTTILQLPYYGNR